MQLLKEETYLQQAKLAGYCRNGEVPADLIDINKENLYQYRRLCYNIVSDIIETAYPITYSLLESDIWDDLIRNFFADHKCQTPQVWKMPLEFHGYCIENAIQEKLNIPFLNDLLYFEWLELEVHTMEDSPYPVFDTKGNWLKDKIALNPEHRLIRLSFPVHLLSPKEITEEKRGDYFLLIYREKESGNVQFIDLSMFYTFVLENLKNGALLEDILTETNSLFQINDVKLLKERALAFITDLKKRGFVLGFLPN
jgi:hypothetical protein